MALGTTSQKHRSDREPFLLTAGQEVTMRGDLDKKGLSELVESLASSNMEGILRLCNPLEQRSVFLRDGFLHDLVFDRPDHRRIGELLIGAGLVSPQDMQAALSRQPNADRPLGEILVEAGLVQPEEIEQVAQKQALEDLYGLFTWQFGTFEFYQGPSKDPEAQKRLQRVPKFATRDVLAEVRRRAPKWEKFQSVLGGVDEIPVTTATTPPDDLTDDQRRVLDLVDGTHSIREITQSTPLGLFECANICLELLRRELIELSPPDRVLQVAEGLRQRSEPRRALIVLRALADRPGDLEVAQVKEIATAMDRAGDARLAARCLWKAAKRLTVDESIEMLREACTLDKRSSYLLESLQKQLLVTGNKEKEIADVTSRLADALVDEGKSEAALAQLQKLDGSHIDETNLVVRKTKLLRELGRDDEAIDALEDLAMHLDPATHRDRIAAVYEQILAIDERRRDIAKLLADLRTTLLQKLTRRFLMFGLPALVVLAGGWLYMHSRAQARIDNLVAEVSALLEAGELDAIPSRLESASLEFGDIAELADLRDMLASKRSELTAGSERARLNQLRNRLATAGDHLEHAEFGEALSIYTELIGDPQLKAETISSAKARFTAIAMRLRELAINLPSRVPEPVTEVFSRADRAEVLAAIEVEFLEPDHRMAKAILAAANDTVLAEIVGAARLEAAIEHARTINDTFELVRSREQAYQQAQGRNDVMQRLQPVFIAAKQHEEEHDFAAAAKAYAQLVADYPRQDEMLEHLREQAVRCAAIVELMEKLATATRDGNFEEARLHFRSLTAAEPNVPFGRMVELPIRVETTPPGATVMIGEDKAGIAPILAAYHPGMRTAVRIALDGFVPTELTIPESFDGRLDVILVKAPTWRAETRGSVQFSPVFDADGVAYFTDRSGTISAIDPRTGGFRWSVQTDDLSGLLSQPQLFGDTLIVSSFDGDLRCVSRRNGALVWQVSNIPAEGAPALIDSTALIATVDGEAVGIDARSGAERYRVTLPGTVRQDCRAAGSVGLVVTDNGWAVGLQITNGKELWRKHIGEGVSTSPVTDGIAMFCCNDEGSVLALSVRDGSQRWRRDHLGELPHDPVLTSTHVLVAGPRVLRSFALASGQPGPTLRNQTEWSSGPASGADRVAIGDRDGVVHVVTAAELDPCYLIRAEQPPSAPMGISGDGTGMAMFGNGETQGFANLR